MAPLLEKDGFIVSSGSGISISVPDYEIDANTMLLAHFNADFSDEVGATWTANEYWSISGVDPKFGTGSAYTDTTEIPALSNAYSHDYGSGPWTIEMWLKTSYTFTTMGLFCHGKSQGAVDFAINAYVGSNGVIVVKIGNTAGDAALYTLTGGTSWVDGNWHHLAVVRNGDRIDVYKDGTSIAYQDLPEGFVMHHPTSAYSPFLLGGLSQGYPTIPPVFKYHGYFDEFRLSDIARWTSDFSPRTSPY